MTFDPEDNENEVKKNVENIAKAWGRDDKFEVCRAIQHHYKNAGIDVSVRDVLYYMQNVHQHSKEVEQQLLLRTNRMILTRIEQNCLLFRQKSEDGTDRIVINPSGLSSWNQQAKFHHKLLKD